MTNLFDHAVLSAQIYANARGLDNRNPVPLNWTPIGYIPDGGPNGFTAGAYKNGDAIHIADFDANDPLATQSFASFQFADGTNQDDTQIGTGVEDRLDGKGGNDKLWRLRDTRKSRRWQHGEGMLRAANDTTWRRAA